MEYEARIEMTKAYFEESFEQWLMHKSKFRRRQYQIGALFMIAGGIFMIYGQRPFYIFALAFGFFQILEFVLYRRKWIHQRMNVRSGNSDSSVEIRVSDTGIYHKGPTSEGTINWDGVKAVIPTSKGLFLAVGDGISIYVPDTSMSSPEFKELVVNKVASCT